jgi:hypothetical protein
MRGRAEQVANKSGPWASQAGLGLHPHAIAEGMPEVSATGNLSGAASESTLQASATKEFNSCKITPTVNCLPCYKPTAIILFNMLCNNVSLATWRCLSLFLGHT